MSDSQPIRILIAGFQHETNTFAPTKADWAAFNRDETFPAYVHGPAMVERFAGAKATGPMAADPADLPWRKLPPTMSRRP